MSQELSLADTAKLADTFARLVDAYIGGKFRGEENLAAFSSDNRTTILSALRAVEKLERLFAEPEFTRFGLAVMDRNGKHAAGSCGPCVTCITAGRNLRVLVEGLRDLQGFPADDTLEAAALADKVGG